MKQRNKMKTKIVKAHSIKSLTEKLDVKRTSSDAGITGSAKGLTGF